MQARKYRRIYEPDVPVLGQTNIPEPKKPGWFAGKKRREQYADKVEQRIEDQSRLENKYHRDQSIYESRQRRNRQMGEENERAAARRLMMKNMPEAVKTNTAAQIVGDRVIDAIRAGQAAAQLPGRVHPGAYIAGASALGTAGLLNAYSQQEQDGLGTGPISTAARATSNLFGGGEAITGGVGTDPLALARNNVAQAESYLGSPRMLEALVLDQADARQTEPIKEDIQFTKEVKELAEYLLTVPSRNAEGDYIYMSPRDAYSQARQMIELDQQY